MEDMYEDVKWLIDDQYVTHLRRKSPVTLEVLKQVRYTVNLVGSIVVLFYCFYYVPPLKKWDVTKDEYSLSIEFKYIILNCMAFLM